MIQTPRKMDLSNLETTLTRQLEDVTGALDDRITALETPASVSVSFAASPNYIVNGTPDYSTMAYTTAGTTPSTAGDGNHSCYNWLCGTTASTDLSAGLALVDSGHSTFGGLNADSPIWDRTNGTFLLGSSSTNYDVFAPLKTDFVFPGKRFYVYFEASVAGSSTNIGSGNQFYCGFWDNTAGQRKWISGSSFTPTASVYGVAGARTLKYKVHAKTDSGVEMLSTEVTVATAPSTLTTGNHVRLSFTGAPGFIEYNVYRLDGSNYYRVAQIRNSIDLQFYDMVESGSTVVPVPGYPSVTATAPRAYAQTVDFEPAALGSFQAHTMTIQVPTTYDRSVTGNLQQYLRFGLTGLVNASGDRRQVVIRHMAVSEGYGGWVRCALDFSAASGPSTAATSAPTGGNPTGDPPDGGSGGSVCLLLDTKIDVPGGVEEIRNITKGDFIEHNGKIRVRSTKEGTVQFIWEIETENGFVVGCSDTHKWCSSEDDYYGKKAGMLEVGDILLTKLGPSPIIRKECIFGQFRVKEITIPSPHKYWANGIASRNRKNDDQVIVL